jgi:hypothetical protein
MPLQLNLEHFESAFTMDTSAALVVSTVSNVSGHAATITLNTSVSASAFKNTFYIKADTDILSDASSVWYFVDKSKWANASATLNPINGTVTDGQYVASDDVGKDFIREIANQCFGTHLGSDLFTNEDAMFTDISGKCATVSVDLNSKISAADITSGNVSGILGSEGSYYLDDSFDGSNNITKLMFDSLYTQFPTRFVDISSNLSYTSKGTGFYHLPFEANDVIEFKLTLTPHADTFTGIPTKSGDPDPRVYKCSLTLA